MRQTGLNATGADQIAAALAGSKLLHLDLSGNSDVRDEGTGDRVGSSSTERVRLKELDLSGCGLTDLGMTI